MSIVSAMTLAQLQTTRHLLQEMEADGLKTFAEARQKISREEERQTVARAKGLRKVVAAAKRAGVCPSCGHHLQIVVSGNREIVKACRKCRWSALVEAQ